SKLSSIGGTLRLGELVPGGVIRHVMKVNLYGLSNYYYDATSHGYRWPARQADSGASTRYGGTTSALPAGSHGACPAPRHVAAPNGARGGGGGAPRVGWAPEFGTGAPGPSEPTAPPPALPSVPVEWFPVIVGPGLALGLLVIAFAVSRRSSRSRRHRSHRKGPGTSRPASNIMQGSAKPRPVSRPRRYIPPEEFEDEPSEF